MGITLNVWIFSGIIGVAYIMGYMMSRTMGRVLAVEGAEPEMAKGETVAWSERMQGESQEKSKRSKRQDATVLSESTKRRDAVVMPESRKRQDAVMTSERMERQNTAVMSEGTERLDASELSGRAMCQDASEISGRAMCQDASELSGRAMCQDASEISGRTMCQDASETPGRAVQQKAVMKSGRAVQQKVVVKSGRAVQQKTAVMSGRTAQQSVAGMPGRVTWPDETAWEEESTWEEEPVWEEEPEMPVRQRPRSRTGRAYPAAGQSDREANRKDYGGETREWQKAHMQRRYRSRSRRDQQAKPAGHPIASPVAGHVDVLEGQGRRGVLLTPEDNKVYAPASGKIIHLYPRGNEFLLRTDSGVVLRLQAGERDAEMTRDYFRPRIMQNEFVSKGKLLLEYDREALARDGYDTHVSMTVEEEERSYDLSVTGSMWVKNGQDCLWVL